MLLKQILIFILIAILFVGISDQAFGLIQGPIVVMTDKPSYSDGETIIVTGEVRDLYSGTPVSLIVIDPDGHVVALSQLQVSADKKFSTEITAGGAMRTAGSYTVEVTYGTQNRVATTSFEFGGPIHIITLSSNHSVYTNGATVAISGNIEPFDSSSPSAGAVTYRIMSPTDGIVTIAQLYPNSDGSFKFNFMYVSSFTPKSMVLNQKI